MSLIAIEEHRHLFRSDTAMAEFADLLTTATKEDDTPLVTFGDRHIATVISPKTMERVLSDRILRRLAKKPKLWTKFVQKLGEFNDQAVVD